MAAVLASGPAAVLSHASAGALWGVFGSRRLNASRQPDLPVHVTSPGQGKSRRGIQIHRSRTLTQDQVTHRLGIPVTTPSRTLVDLRRILPSHRFDQALRQAEFLGLPVDGELEPDHTRSELERRFLALCRRHRLPNPEVITSIGKYTVDFLWPRRRLAAEVDGYRAHGTRSAFEFDRARDVHLQVLGYEVVRFTWRQVTERPAEVARALRRLL